MESSGEGRINDELWMIAGTMKWKEDGNGTNDRIRKKKRNIELNQNFIFFASILCERTDSTYYLAEMSCMNWKYKLVKVIGLIHSIILSLISVNSFSVLWSCFLMLCMVSTPKSGWDFFSSGKPIKLFHSFKWFCLDHATSSSTRNKRLLGMPILMERKHTYSSDEWESTARNQQIYSSSFVSVKYVNTHAAYVL